MTRPLLEVNDLKKHFFVQSGPFGAGAGTVYAVDGVSFAIDRAETLALVGESACGKSTVGRCILRLFDITAGRVVLDGKRIDNLSPGALRPFRRRVQVVFQDPFSSLNPRMRVRDILAEPIRNFRLAKSGLDLAGRVERLMDAVRLPRDAAKRWPHEFSGGQRQRIGIARARRRARPHRLRRGGLGARRVGEGADRQPAARPAAGAGARHAIHQPRPRHRRARDAPRGGDVLGQDRRAGAEAGSLCPTQAPLHAGAVVGCSGGGARRGATAHHPQGRRAEPDRSAHGLPLSRPLPYAFDRCRTEEPRLRDTATGHLAACHFHDLPAAQNPLAAAA